MILRLFFPLFAVLAFTLVNCTNSTGETEYRTQYEVDFSRIDQGVSIDSAEVRVYVNGELSNTKFFKKSDILNQKVTITGIMSGSGDSVKIAYSVWSNDVIVAQGADSFVPSENPEESTDLMIDANGVAIVLQQIGQSSSIDDESISSSSISNSGTSSANPSSSSASLPQQATCGTSDFSVGFSADLSNVTEGSETLKLLIGGVKGEKTAVPRTVVLKVKSGTSDIQIPDVNVLVPANTPACTDVPFDINVVADQLVEGNEKAVIQIADLGGFSAGDFQTQTVNVHDGDSAWVTIENLPASVTEPNVDSAISISLMLHTTNKAKLAGEVVASFTVESTSLKAKDYKAATEVTFPIASDSGTVKTTPLTLLANTLAEGSKTAILNAIVSSGSATGISQKLNLQVLDNDFEYLLLLNNSGIATVYDPEGAKQGTISMTGAVGATITSAGVNHYITSQDAIVDDYKVFTQQEDGTFKFTNSITVSTSGSTYNYLSKDKYEMSIGETYSSDGFLFAGVSPNGLNAGHLDTTGGTWKLSLELNSAYSSKFVSVNPSPQAGDSVFYTGGDRLNYFEINTNGALSQTLIGSNTTYVVGGLSVSKTGECMAYHEDGLMYYSSRYSQAVAVQPKGVTIGNMVDIIATRVGTFWLINSGSTEDVSFAYEVDKTGTVLHTIPTIPQFTAYSSGAWIRTSRPIKF